MSSASLKSLMAAKKASSAQRITHPFASYDRQSRLTCTLCPATVLKHDNLWGAHLISKGHRVNAQRYETQQQALREREEAAAAAASSAGKRKRKRSQSAESEGEDDTAAEGNGKRAREGTQDSDHDDDDDDDDDEGEKENGRNALPDGFFTDPSQAPVRSTTTEDEDADPAPGTEEDDPEWAAFEASLREAPEPATTSTTTSTAKATIFAAPVAYEFGAPKVAEEGEEEAEAQEEEEEETEEERLERWEREQVSSTKYGVGIQMGYLTHAFLYRLRQREEIMERIEAEEREQLEADSKVTALKRKLEAIKEARKKKKTEARSDDA
ncbi:BQ2448_7629 [Microbotryum intermedium]|uniref:BQ2448_7629 protein n=1 Tax=Microbotryum intermedium TaxID=269621 RepID=A0A238FLE7_9BASI|nr:BQ2448_7629 [Microbotryum intermedium]